MTRLHFMLLAAFGSLALLLGAFAFQHIGGMAPCKLCIWQRWPHGVAIGLGALALIAGPRPLIALAGALAALTTAGIGLYHVGVERKWWEGPQGCTGSGLDLTQSPQDFLNALEGVALVRCDEIPWELLGVSMAGWNAIASLAFAALWIAALRPRSA